MTPITKKVKDLFACYDTLMTDWHYAMDLWIEENFSSPTENDLPLYIEASIKEIATLVKKIDSLRVEVELEVEKNLLNLSVNPENFKGYGIFIIQSFKHRFTRLKDINWHISLVAKEKGIYEMLLKNENPLIPTFINDFKGFDFIEGELFFQLEFDYSSISRKFEGYDFYPLIQKNIPFCRASNYSTELQQIDQGRLSFDTNFNKETKPIWWQGTGRQLGYLLDELAAKGFIDKNTNFNEAIKMHFIDKDKNPFKDSIKQNKSGTGQNKNQKPKGAESLEEILKKLPNKK